MKRVSYRYQRTIARPGELHGVGFLTGAQIRLCFRPAPPDTGVVFVRLDLKPPAQVPARLELVSGTSRRTTIGRPPVQVGLVEHVLAALAGLHIDNCLVELDAPEPPGLDGSAQGFVKVLRDCGAVLQSARRPVWTVPETVVVAHKGATLTIHPSAENTLKMSYLLDYGLVSPIDCQRHSQQVTPESFANELACCRTFLLESEAAELQRQGLGTRTTINDLLVFGRRGPIDNELRFANEPARHKMLDMVGDLSLLGSDLCGHVVGYRSGHQLNVEMVRVLTRTLAEKTRPEKTAA